MTTTIFDAEVNEAIAYAAELIAGAGAIVISAGAGMGVDSGLPDFHGVDGFWRAYPALRASGTGFREIASAAHFDVDPHQAWGFYGHRLALYRRTRPHAGFGLLKQWADACTYGYTVHTSNVDGHFSDAGFAPERLHECHGSIHLLQCSLRCSDALWPADGLTVQIDEQSSRWTGPLPTCIHCGALARPNIAMFDDSAWIAARAERAHERQDTWLGQVPSPLVIEIGAGSGANSVNKFSEAIVRSRQGRLIRINPEGDAHEAADVALAMPALQALSAIDQQLARGAVSSRARAVPIPDTAQGKAGSAAEQTFERRLALLALLPEAPATGLGAGALTERLQAAPYACVRRTVERDLQALQDAAPMLLALGIEVIHAADPRHAHGRLWSRTTRPR
jgi:NAD-dependent SIR2 family protein deacetylase